MSLSFDTASVQDSTVARAILAPTDPTFGLNQLIPVKNNTRKAPSIANRHFVRLLETNQFNKLQHISYLLHDGAERVQTHLDTGKGIHYGMTFADPGLVAKRTKAFVRLETGRYAHFSRGNVWVDIGDLILFAFLVQETGEFYSLCYRITARGKGCVEDIRMPFVNADLVMAGRDNGKHLSVLVVDENDEHLRDAFTFYITQTLMEYEKEYCNACYLQQIQETDAGVLTSMENVEGVHVDVTDLEFLDCLSNDMTNRIRTAGAAFQGQLGEISRVNDVVSLTLYPCSGTSCYTRYVFKDIPGDLVRLREPLLGLKDGARIAVKVLF